VRRDAQVIGPGAQVVFEVGALLVIEAGRGGAGVEERAQRAPDLSGGGLLEQAAQLSERARFGWGGGDDGALRGEA
jgi:hypothetical protein